MNIVEGLYQALQTVLDDLEFEKENRDDSGVDDVDPHGYQFRSASQSWEDHMKSPVKSHKEMERLEERYRYQVIEGKSNRMVHRTLKNLVLKNVYRGYYDISDDQAVRKPDATMSAIVDTSEALKSAEKLHDMGIHPSLLFFDKDLFETQIQRCMTHLHGRNIRKEDRSSAHAQQIKTINNCLTAE